MPVASYHAALFGVPGAETAGLGCSRDAHAGPHPGVRLTDLRPLAEYLRAPGAT